MVPKHNKPPRQCTVVLTLCTFSIIFLFISVVALDPKMYNNYKEMQIMDDLPVKNDFEKYLTALEKLVNFADRNRYCVETNLCFGIYLINVNLRCILEMKGRPIPFRTQIRLVHLMKTNDNIIEYFADEFQKQYGDFNPLLVLLNHDLEELCPIIQFTKFNIDMWKKMGRDNEERKYQNLKWSDYEDRVYDMDNSSPTPEESGECLTLLAVNPTNDDVKLSRCYLFYRCFETTLNGTDYGYGISHRLLLLQMARYWRGCVIVSDAIDKQIRDNLCAKMYDEVEYIANHNFLLNDLAMEDIALCSLEGHAQFLRRSWIHELLNFQTEAGNFKAFDQANSSDATWYIDGRTPFNRTWEAACSSHTTSTAGSMLAAAIRLFVENHY